MHPNLHESVEDSGIIQVWTQLIREGVISAIGRAHTPNVKSGFYFFINLRLSSEQLWEQQLNTYLQEVPHSIEFCMHIHLKIQWSIYLDKCFLVMYCYGKSYSWRENRTSYCGLEDNKECNLSNDNVFDAIIGV